MTFSWDFNLGQVIPLAIAVIGLIAGYVTLRIRTGDNDERTKGLATRVDAYGTAIADLRLHVESVCVKKDDLERVEDRINRRLDTVEHTIRNTSATILAVLGRRDHGPNP
ncbi:hypothetical protein [Methylobacterium iners]|uniref:DUF2746 domain-containing protein n=1 Tax=Methylobacterium iners TaxID=418707 RepID=A0ABQ4S5M3_9HYPH|nr:hypothetical protein [Methylobacterium iners]GJD97457.1 hypothetical protein OCOJLMKI_4688 [Methylobacterium iners]